MKLLPCCCQRTTIVILGNLYLLILFDLLQDYDFATGQFLELNMENNDTDEDYLLNIGFTNLNCSVADWDYFPVSHHHSHNNSFIRQKQQKQRWALSSFHPSQCSSILEDDSRYMPQPRQPTHTSCHGYDGVLWIDKGDFGGASGMTFFLYMVGMLRWAEQHNYKPFVHFHSHSRKIYDDIVHSNTSAAAKVAEFTMLHGMEIVCARDARDPLGFWFPGRPYNHTALHPKTFRLDGTGVWEHYFEPVSDFVPGDRSCQNKPLVTLDDVQILPGLHTLAPWMPHAWRQGSPPYLEQSHVSFREWMAPQRVNSSELVQRYIDMTLPLQHRAACAHPNHHNKRNQDHVSLGVHIRHGDKRNSIRRIIPTKRFLPFCKDFLNAHQNASIYIATDSAVVLEEIYQTWPSFVTERIVTQPFVKALSRNRTAAFDLSNVGHHRTNLEALTDILALSQCTYLVHGWSAMTEAAMYLNPKLISQQVDLEDDEWKDPLTDFRTMIRNENRN